MLPQRKVDHQVNLRGREGGRAGGGGGGGGDIYTVVKCMEREQYSKYIHVGIYYNIIVKREMFLKLKRKAIDCHYISKLMMKAKLQ